MNFKWDLTVKYGTMASVMSSENCPKVGNIFQAMTPFTSYITMKFPKIQKSLTSTQSATSVYTNRKLIV